MPCVLFAFLFWITYLNHSHLLLSTEDQWVSVLMNCRVLNFTFSFLFSISFFFNTVYVSFNNVEVLWFLTDETQKLLKELAHRKPLQVPNIYHHLPHLLNNEGSLHPAVQVGQGRTGGERNDLLQQFFKFSNFSTHYQSSYQTFNKSTEIALSLKTVSFLHFQFF